MTRKRLRGMGGALAPHADQGASSSMARTAQGERNAQMQVPAPCRQSDASAPSERFTAPTGCKRQAGDTRLVILLIVALCMWIGMILFAWIGDGR
jgi:hypothetical protein